MAMGDEFRKSRWYWYQSSPPPLPKVEEGELTETKSAEQVTKKYSEQKFTKKKNKEAKDSGKI